jgi:hypothetical protein
MFREEGPSHLRRTGGRIVEHANGSRAFRLSHAAHREFHLRAARASCGLGNGTALTPR